MTTRESGRGAQSREELANEAQLWRELHELIDGLTPEEAQRPGYYVEGWNAKDAIAHVGTWMAQGAQMLDRIRAGTYREGELDVDAENARFHAAMKDIPLETVHLQADSARAGLLRAWAALDRITPEAAFWVRK
ncbi:MAG TPA: maleylpyruvate isomerase N-terminal domain-containing protein, partial [Candidatus Limnocylindria bacterium]|nr:maleylpyruvate isomerase N-terminal domain-containing protein [Candidatus Limnocylindria bacterium]